MIRVLHTIDTTGPGGAETVFINLVKDLDPCRFRSFAAIRGPGWVFDTLRKNRIEILFIPSRGGFNFLYLLELVKIIRRYKIDIVQSHLLGSNVYCSLAGLICRVPVVSVFHGFVDIHAGEVLMAVKRKLVNLGSKKIVFVSDRLCEYYVQNFGISPLKSITIYNGVNTKVFRPQKDDSIRKELGLGPGHILIGALGNIRSAKGYDVFLKAARLVYDRHPECRFLIAGQGAGALYDALLELRNQLGLENVFFFLGFRENTSMVLNNLDIFVLSSVSEGFSISTIEAMACGIPVIVTRSGGPEEIVMNGENGLCVECCEKAIANAFHNLMVNPELRSKLSRTALRLVRNSFSLRAMIRKYESVYDFNAGR